MASNMIGMQRIRQFDGNDEATPTKKCRIADCTFDVDHLYANISEKLLKYVAVVLDRLLDEDCYSFVRMTPLKILRCNAVETRPLQEAGYCFSKAYCSIGEYEQDFPLASVFMRGLNMLMNYIDVDKREVPKNHQDKFVLDMLLHYLHTMNEDAQKPFENLEMLEETDLNVILANHLFGKLATSSEFIVDKQFKETSKGRGNKPSCPCKITDCKMTGRFGDTSIGNGSVWHGNLNLIINNQVFVEVPVEEDSDVCSPEGKSDVEVSILTRNPQIIAETIVFSFLQKKRHPESAHFLFPSIGITEDAMVIYMYDSEHDVLLESSSIPLLITERTFTGGINLTAIIVSWLVVNYKYLSNRLSGELKDKQSGFFLHANSKMNIYENELQLGDVDTSDIPKIATNEKRLVHNPEIQRMNEYRLKSIMKFGSSSQK